jgi:alpha-galactosidase/6-phospho-beta-glucosidase family protein
VHPRAASPLPPPVLTWVRIHVAAQELVVQAALERREEPALQAVLLDPLCHRLSPAEASSMLRALLAHNARFVPSH